MTICHYTETAAPGAAKRDPGSLNNREFDLAALHVAQKAGSDKKRTVDISGASKAILGRQRTQRILLTAGHDAPQSSIRKYVGAARVHHSPCYGCSHVT